MQIIPAIDLINGNCVRLEQGRYDKETVYSDSPVDMAKFWVSLGAQRLHLVDLDGARDGSMANFEVIKLIRAAIDITIDVGGGIRSFDDAKRLLNIGIDKVIFGTTAVKNPEIVEAAVKEFGDKITVGIDAKNGNVSISGWIGDTQILAEDLVKSMDKIGVSEYIYTDIAKDGMLVGPNLEETKNICDITHSDIIASGGIAGLNDIENLLDLGCDNLIGAITGKALYDGKLDLEEAIRLCLSS